MPPPRRPDPVVLGLLGLTAVGVLIRALHLDIPLRYDEVHSFTEYAREGWLAATSSYDSPNNHIFHTLLMAVATDLFGDGPFAIRLPAFLAGCAVPLAAGLLALRVGGRVPALLACGLAAGWSVLVEYSTNARGYSMICLFTLLAALLAIDIREGRRGWRWVGLAAVSVAGLYTIPVMALPWLGIVIWLATGAPRAPSDARVRELGAVAAFVAAVALVTAYLYLPVLMVEGPGELLANRYVSGLPWSDFWATMPEGPLAVLYHWTWGVPLVVAVAVGAGLAWELVRPGGRRPPAGLLLPMLGVSVVFILSRRTLGYERVWLWVLPLLLVLGALGLGALLERLPRGRASAAARWGLAPLVAAWMGLHLVRGEYVDRSLETGAFPDGPEVAQYLASVQAPNDFVITDFVTREPLDYYLARQPRRGVPPEPNRAPRRAWIVLNLTEEQRVQRVLELLETEDVPLRNDELETEIGSTRIYSRAWVSPERRDAVEGRGPGRR